MIEMHGIVTNAINNKPVSSAEVDFPDQSTHTDGLGKFSHRVPVGQTHVVVKKSGFTEADHDLSPITAEENHLVISPILPPSGWRIVLTWKQEPRDLDSHLFFGAAQKCHLYYRYRSVPCGSNRVATLDTDARYGIGPETVTVQNAQSCTSSCDLVYKVYKYAPSGAYSRQCGAVVTVYNGDSVKGVYKFDEGDGHIEDRWWAVVRINPHSGTVSECGSVACPA